MAENRLRTVMEAYGQQWNAVNGARYLVHHGFLDWGAFPWRQISYGVAFVVAQDDPLRRLRDPEGLGLDDLRLETEVAMRTTLPDPASGDQIFSLEYDDLHQAMVDWRTVMAATLAAVPGLIIRPDGDLNPWHDVEAGVQGYIARCAIRL
jgi:hypothetical protein